MAATPSPGRKDFSREACRRGELHGAAKPAETGEHGPSPALRITAAGLKQSGPRLNQRKHCEEGAEPPPAAQANVAQDIGRLGLLSLQVPCASGCCRKRGPPGPAAARNQADPHHGTALAQAGRLVGAIDRSNRMASSHHKGRPHGLRQKGCTSSAQQAARWTDGLPQLSNETEKSRGDASMTL